jgi:hypothetical protein
MAFNIDSFRTNLRGDGARPNLFDVYLQFPGFVTLGGVAAPKSQFQIRASHLPGSTIGTTPVFYFGREAKLAGNRSYADWTVTILNDEDFLLRNAFEQWANALNDPQQNIRAAGATVIDGGYGQNARVTQYAKTGAIIKQYQIMGMFPVDISPIDLDWGSNDSVEEYSVTLAYQYWLDPTLNGGPAVGFNLQL